MPPTWSSIPSWWPSASAASPGWSAANGSSPRPTAAWAAACIRRSPGPSSKRWRRVRPSPASSCGDLAPDPHAGRSALPASRRPASSRVIGAFAVEPALERHPRALALAFEALELPGGVLGHGVRRYHHLLAALRGGDLQAAGLLEIVHLVEGVADGAARGQQAVMAQDHGVVVAEVAHQPVALVEVERDALVVVV